MCGSHSRSRSLGVALDERRPPRSSEAAAQLDGDWRGSDFVLRVDARRAQASVDPTHPFEWKHFLVKEVTRTTSYSAVGAELFEAKLDADTLTLTSTSFRGERVLFRDAQLRGTPRSSVASPTRSIGFAASRKDFADDTVPGT